MRFSKDAIPSFTTGDRRIHTLSVRPCIGVRWCILIMISSNDVVQIGDGGAWLLF